MCVFVICIYGMCGRGVCGLCDGVYMKSVCVYVVCMEGCVGDRVCVGWDVGGVCKGVCVMGAGCGHACQEHVQGWVHPV